MKEIIYGRNPVQEWLSAGLPVVKIYLAKDVHGKSIRSIQIAVSQRGIPVHLVSRTRLDYLSGSRNHQGIVAEVQLPSYAEPEDIFALAAQRDEPALLAVLDGVQDPHNLGAILRTADGAGVHGIIIPKDKAVGLTPGVVKASAGAAAHIPVARVTNVVRAMRELKERGVWFVGCDQEASQDYTAVDLQGPVGIVLGGEGSGLRRLVREACDFLVSIPMLGRVNSLNVSVTAALMFYEARRQRRSPSV